MNYVQPITEYKIVSGSNLIMGENIFSVIDFHSRESRYQVMRFATEVFPAVLAIEGPQSISSFWATCFYLSAILLNFGFLVVVWGSVVDSIIAINHKVFKLWKSIITFISCVAAFVGCLPMTTSVSF